MNNMFDILEICLQEVENGAEPEAVLARYPSFADELRPILWASVDAKRMATPAPSSEVVRRNRAKLLQRAAQMREEKKKSFVWFPTLQRVAVAFVLLFLFFISGTGLVRAASSSIPGDNLYPVKRSWENVSLFFTFDPKARDALEVEYEQERLDELHQLFASGRSARVDFVGVVTQQFADGWQVYNFRVIITPQTELPGQPIPVGAAVRVRGTTGGDMVVQAERIELLPPGAALPEVEDTPHPEIEPERTSQPSATSELENGNSGPGSGNETPEIEGTESAPPTSKPKTESFEGVLNSNDLNVWIINGIPVNVSNAEIKGILVVGASVKVEGYFGSDGVFVAVKIEIINSGSGGANGNSNVNGNDNINDNGGSGGNVNDNGGGGGGGGGNDNGGGGGGGNDNSGGGGGGGNDNGGGGGGGGNDNGGNGNG